MFQLISYFSIQWGEIFMDQAFLQCMPFTLKKRTTCKTKGKVQLWKHFSTDFSIVSFHTALKTVFDDSTLQNFKTWSNCFFTFKYQTSITIYSWNEPACWNMSHGLTLFAFACRRTNKCARCVGLIDFPKKPAHNTIWQSKWFAAAPEPFAFSRK